MQRLIILMLLALGISISAVAGEMSHRQRLFNVDLNIEPNALSGLKQVQGSIPVDLITNRAGEIVGIQVGSDEQLISLESLEGVKWKLKLNTIAVKPEWGARNRFQMVADTPITKDKEIFTFDSTKLDPKHGGTIRLRFANSIVFSTSNEVEFKVQPNGGRWVASVVERIEPRGNEDEPGWNREVQITETPISNVKLRASITGAGLADPDFVSLDPNKIVEQLTVQPIQDPRMIERHMANTKRLIDMYSVPGGFEDKEKGIGRAELKVLPAK